MKAFRSPGVSAGSTDLAVQRAAVFLSQILLVISLPVAADEPKAPAAAQESKEVVWKAREVGFSYRSSLAIYSCGAIRDRVASVLRAIGARDDVDVKVTGCDAIGTPVEDSRSTWGMPSSRLPSDRLSDRLSNRVDRAQMVNVRVRLMMPTEVTPEVLAEIDKDKSRRELISRVTGNPAAALNDPSVFPAQWQTVTLSHRTIGLVAEECELLEQMASSIIPQLGARVVRRSFTCDRNSVSRFPPQLTVEALMGVQFGTGMVPQLPAEGESKGDPDPAAPGASGTETPAPATAKPPG